VDLTDFQAYTLSVTATFDDENETTAQQSITFEICDPENPPEEEELESAEGEDIEALQKAKNEIDSAFKRFMDLAASTTDIDALTNAYQQWKAAIQSFVSIAESALSSPEALNQDKGYLGASYPEVANAIYTYSEGTGSMGDLTLRCGELKSVTDHMMTIIETQI
jgi:hypothetical protein